MSFAHVRFIQLDLTDVTITYKVETLDFNDGEHWDSMGVLSIDRAKETYSFQLSPLSVEKKVIPPEVYGVLGEQRKILIAEQYNDHGWGAWSARIHQWANSFIRDKNYPVTYPSHFFKKSD